MNLVAAIVAGLAGTVAISLLMAMAPRMGMPPMAIWDMLGTMFSKDGNRILGWALHFMMGVIFAVIYAVLWSSGLGAVGPGSGAVFGAVHWLAAGLAMGGVGMMHAGIRAGTVQAPGAWMLQAGGLMAFLGGLISHVVYGIVVALVYGLIA
jgi:uncharacterized membrane protein YagU involved in acid resistance